MSKVITTEQILFNSIIQTKWPVGIVRKLADMSYRKINDWDSKDYLKTDRSSKRSWRQFLAEEVFGLQIFSKLAKLTIAASKLKWIISQVKSGGLFEKALALYFQGAKVYFLSDLETYACVIEPKDIEGLIYNNEDKAATMVCVNGLLDNLMAILSSSSETIKQELLAFLSSDAQKEKEFAKKLLEIIRSGKYAEIKISRRGEENKIRGKRYIQKNIPEEIIKQMKLGGKITTHVDKKNGKITSAEIEEDLS